MQFCSRRGRALPMLAIASMLALPGCGQPDASAPGEGEAIAQTPDDGMKPISEYHVGAALTDEECQRWAEELIQATVQGDTEAQGRLMDWTALLDRAISGIDAPDDVLTELGKGVQIASQRFFKPFQKTVQAGGSYKVLRVRQGAERSSALMRLIPRDSNPNYHEVFLARHTDGHIRGVDIHMYLTAESMCEMLRRRILQGLSLQDKSLLARLSGRDSLTVKHMQDIVKIGELVRFFQSEEALQICKKLPPELRRDKTVIGLRYAAAQNCTEADYLSEINEIEKLLPDNGSMDLMLLDGYMLRGEYRRALRCINRFDKVIGGDPYLDSMRANIYSQEGERDKALEAVGRAVENAPDLVEVHWTLLTLQLKQQDYDAVVETINRISEKFSIEFGDLADAPAYAEFIKSPQYAAWLASKSEPSAASEPE